MSKDDLKFCLIMAGIILIVAFGLVVTDEIEVWYKTKVLGIPYCISGESRR